jgi:hypothetical protein
MIDVDVKKAIRHFKAELRTLNETIGAVEDSLEQSLAAKYEKHTKNGTQPADTNAAEERPAQKAAPMGLLVPTAFDESIRLLKAHLQSMETLPSSEWNVWLR